MKPVVFHYDYASPWSYLASELAPTRLAGLEVRWAPIYLRGLPAFATGIPYDGPKLEYLMKDLQRCAAHEGVPLAAPATFPLNGLHALRVAIAARARGKFDEVHWALMRATWAESKDVNDPAVVLDVACAATGLDRAELAAAATSAEVKGELRASTERALAEGIFGVPALVVDGELFWGHDRMDYAARAARA